MMEKDFETKNGVFFAILKKKALIMRLLILIFVPLLIVFGVIFLGDRSYILISILIALVSCLPFFLLFEKREQSSRRMVLIAIITAISVVGRFIFAPVQGFKPVCAIVIIAAIPLGGESGFIIGAMSALISNIYFGQGPWTPFQMFAWGCIGFICGFLGRKTKLMQKWWALVLNGVVAGVFYFMMMDVWTTLWYDGVFSFEIYIGLLRTSFPILLLYCVSNVVFLLALAKPLGKKIQRIVTKYEI